MSADIVTDDDVAATNNHSLAVSSEELAERSTNEAAARAQTVRQSDPDRQPRLAR